jgi:hypothetical protein
MRIIKRKDLTATNNKVAVNNKRKREKEEERTVSQ